MTRILPLLLLGCGTEHSLGSTGSEDEDTDDSVDPSACVDELPGRPDTLVLDEAPDPGDAHSAFDGEGVWVVYTTAGRVHALHVDCGATVDRGPFVVSSSGASEPTVAVDGSRMLIAWTAGDHIEHRSYTTGGDTAFDPVSLEAVTGQPALVSVEGGGYVLAAGMETDGDPVEVFLLRLDGDGEVASDPLFVDPGNGWLQYLPTIASFEGTAWAAWTEFSSGERRIRRGTLFPGQDGLSTILTVDASGDRANGSAASGGAWFAYESDAIGGTDVGVRALNGTAFDLGDDGVDDALPTIAAGEDGGAVAWVRDGELAVVRFDREGTVLQERDTGITGLTDHPLQLVRIVDDVYWLAFQSGTPTRLRGRFIRF